MSSIEEFKSKKRSERYYINLIEEVKKINKRLHLFNNINEDIREGFPFSVKDNICVKNVESTASSRILTGYIPPFSATAVERIQKSGFGFLGKTNMDEFGFGSFGLNCGMPARNPFNEEYVAGGSSSGAAIATSILKYHVAIAESTGGSISTPAAFCGVLGFTPTYGLISRYGLIDYSNSLDKIGIMAREADDIRIVFDRIRGSDKYDTTCVDAHLKSDSDKKIFLIDRYMQVLDEEVESHFSKLVGRLENMGYKIKNAGIGLAESSIAAYYVIAMAEASTNLAKYTGFKYGLKNERFSEPYNDFFMESRENFGSEAKRRIVLGTFVRSASVKERYYSKALKLRALLLNETNKILKGGFILAPVMPVMTPKREAAEEMTPLELYKMDMMTIPPNLCGFPQLSFPYAYSNSGLPMGAQLITTHFNDYALLDFAKEWENEFRFRFRYNIGSL